MHLLALPLHEGEETTVEQARQALVAKIGENMNVRRFMRMNATGEVGSYRHGVKIGVIVDLVNGNNELGKDVAMHVAATNPMCVSEEQVPQEAIDKEREIFIAQAKESGKPDEIIEKMVTGRMKKYLAEITLVGQQFVKDPDQTVGKLLSSTDASVASFIRFEVGEGIEKKKEDFAAEVMAQIKS